MKRVVVVGGAGFIGSHLVRRLLSMSSIEWVKVYDNFSSGRAEHFDGLEDAMKTKRLVVHTGDAAKVDDLSLEFVGADTVVHLASNPDISKAIAKPDIDFWEGAYLTQNVCEAARRASVGLIIYASGSGVYGEADIEFTEDHGPLKPISTYGASKLAGEALIGAYCRMFGMSGLAFRFANVVGPRQTHGVGFDFMHRLASGQHTLRILGDGTQCKSYIHVDDVLNAIFCVATGTLLEGTMEVFNVATPDRITVTEIAEMAVEVSGLPRGSVKFEYTGGDRGWRGDVPQIRMNCDKLDCFSGWQWHPRPSDSAMRQALDSLKP